MARAVRSLPTAERVVLSIPPTGRMPSPGPVAGRKCLVWTSLWLGPLFLVWGGFIVLSHQPGLGALTWGRWLFGWSPAGHALVAERLALELQQRAWLTTAPPAQ